jgi:hypothetical protein
MSLTIARPLAADPGAASRFLILTPLFEDWECLHLLLGKLDGELAREGLEADVLVVDDGSLREPPDHLGGLQMAAIKCVLVLRLTRNLGHQRAIAVALPFIEANFTHRAVVVMDSDGEDRPADVVRLINMHNQQARKTAIFALRTKRSEGLPFRFFYCLYRLVFRLLAGQDVRVGNFSILPRALLSRVASVSEIWNHYSAGVRRSRIPCTTLPCPRGVRLAGRSHMNLVSLVTHGLNAISVYGDVLGTRAFLFFGLLTLVSLALVGTAAGVRLTTDLAIPGWATSAVGLAAVILLQSATLSGFFVFLILSSRNSQTFLPARDYAYFLSEFREIPTTFPTPDRGEDLPWWEKTGAPARGESSAREGVDPASPPGRSRSDTGREAIPS